MAATITLNMDDQTAKGIQSLVENAGDAQAAMQSLVKHMKDLQDESGKVGKLSDAFGNVSQKVTAVSTATLATLEVFKKGVEAGKKFVETVNMLADQGNPAAKELQGAFEEVKAAMLDIANDPLVQDMFTGMADSIKNDLIPAMKSIPDGWRETQNWISGAITATTDFIGVTEGAAAEVEAMNEQQAKSIELRKKQAEEAQKTNEIQKVQKKLDEDLAAFEQQRAARAEQERLSKITDEKQLAEMRQKEVDHLKALAAENKLTAEERKKGLTEIALIEERLVGLKKEQADGDKKQAEARQKFIDGVKKQFDTLASAAKEATDKALAAAQKNADAAVAKEKKMVDDLASKILSMRKQLEPGGKEEDIMGQIRGGLSKQSVGKEIADTRARKAMEESAAGGGSKADQNAAARKARERFSRQAMSGGKGISQEEIAEAEGKLAQSVVDQAIASGNLSATQIKALKTAADASATTAQVQAQQQADIENLQKQLNDSLSLTNAVKGRQRAQRGSGG